MISQETSPDLSGLAASFRAAAAEGQLARYYARRWQRSSEMSGWLREDNLAGLTASQGLALYRASGGSQSSTFAANPVAEVRDTLDFLLYDNITLEARFNECVAAGGAYKLQGAGKEFISYLLCLSQPGLLGCWNLAAERALRRLGRRPGRLSRGHWGLRYLDLMDALQPVRSSSGLTHYPEVDWFCYFVSRHKAEQD